MTTLDIVLTDLTFPEKLEDKFCKFRLIVSVKYRDSNNKPTFAREVLPGLGPRDYWECEKDNKNKDNYVRHATEPKVDMDKADIAQREIIFSDLDVQKLERIDLELLDIDIKTGLEKAVQNAIKLLPEVALPLINPALPVSLTMIRNALETATGVKVADLQKALINRAVGKEDGAARQIWVHSQNLTEPPEQTMTLTGAGKQGDYSLTVTMDVS
jgi:hypothetical protein